MTTVPILTYHSISEEPGPTSIAPAIFTAQMEAVAELGVDVVGLDWIDRWLAGEATPARRTVAVTFDDAFRDFAEKAHPVLQHHGFPASVFVPSALVGGAESWRGANTPPRALMDWTDIRALSAAGVAFGSHSRTHRDLTTLAAGELESELAGSRREIEDRLGKPAAHFAPPYGRSNKAVRMAIARHYALSVGVRLGEADRVGPRFDLPRIEMHYYLDVKRWRAFLQGADALYFHARRAARGLREAAQGVVRRAAHQERMSG